MRQISKYHQETHSWRSGFLSIEEITYVIKHFFRSHENHARTSCTPRRENTSRESAHAPVTGRHTMSAVSFGTPFQPTADREYVCHTWFERDRKNIRLETPKGREIFCLWDDAVDEAIEDGFLKAPRCPRPQTSDWQPMAVDYARQQGLIK